MHVPVAFGSIGPLWRGRGDDGMFFFSWSFFSLGSGLFIIWGFGGVKVFGVDVWESGLIYTVCS